MSYLNNRPKTIFCDIDGTLVKHFNPSTAALPSHEMNLLTGTLDKLKEWDMKGYNIILTTGRRESMREVTEVQLSKAGIIYDQLIMGIGGGIRVLINDKKPYQDYDTALSINLDRDKGLQNLDI